MKGGKTMKGLRIAQRKSFILWLGAVAAVFILSAVIIPSAQANGSLTAEKIGSLETRTDKVEANQKQTDKEITSLKQEILSIRQEITSLKKDMTELKARIESLETSLLATSIIFLVLWLGTLIGSLWLRKKLTLLRGKK